MKTKRWLSLFTAITMLLGPVATSTSAEETINQVPDITLSGMISQEIIQQNGHVRLTENFANNLYQAEYENADGSRTVYFFSTPVKYVTDEGETAYIDTSLKNVGVFDRIKGYAYKTDGNAINVYFPAKSNDKVLLEGEDFSITQQICEAAETSITGNVAVARTIQYATSDATSAPTYAYQPTATGYSCTAQFATLAAVKDVAIQLSGEDITSLSSTGDNIAILSGNRTLATVYGSALVDASGCFVQCAETIVFSKGNMHTVSFGFDTSAIPADAVYPLTFTYYNSADRSAWGAETSVASSTYATTSTTTNSTPAIQDTMVNENAPNTNGSNATALTLAGGVGQACRIYTKFDLSSLSTVRYDQILSARYSIYQYYNYPALDGYTEGEHFDIEMHQVSESYNTSTITWNNKPAHYQQCLAGESIIPDIEKNNLGEVISINPLIRYHFMLTSLVQGWLQGLPNNGIVFLMRDESVTTPSGRRFPSSTFTISIGPTFTVTYTTDTTSSDNIGIENNATYLIKCKGSVTENSTSDKALYLTAPSTDGEFVRLQELANTPPGLVAQQWKVVSAGNGYYYLKPISNTNFSLYVMGDTYYETVVSSVTGSGYDPYRKWKFIRNWDGSYHIVSCSSGDDLGIYVPSTTANYIPFHYSTRVTMDHLDDWTLEKVSKGTANVFCFDAEAYNYGGLNTFSLVDDYQSHVLSTGYSSLVVNANQNATKGRSALATSDLWLFSGHGGSSSLAFATTTDNTYLSATNNQYIGYTNRFSVDEFYSKGSLSNLRVVMMSSCQTGNDDVVNNITSSLTGTLYAKGAHFVQTHVNNTSTAGDTWWGYFFAATAQGDTIAEAMEYADDAIWGTDPPADLSAVLFNRHIMGDMAMCLSPKN